MKYHSLNLTFLLLLTFISGCVTTANYGTDAEANKTQTERLNQHLIRFI